MANRRMFSKAVLDSDRFLEMPLSAQALYVHLALRADDDGFVGNEKIIRRMAGASEDDLRLLIENGYIISFENGLIVISHWLIHNSLRSDRYNPTVYQNEKSMLYVDENRVYNLGIPTGNQVSYQRLTQVSIGKVSSDKESEDEGSAAPARFVPIAFGEYHHVTLSKYQYDKLKEDFGEDRVLAYIQKVDEYCQIKGVKYNDYNLTIRKWIRKDSECNDGNCGNTAVSECSVYSTDI